MKIWYVGVGLCILGCWILSFTISALSTATAPQNSWKAAMSHPDPNNAQSVPLAPSVSKPLEKSRQGSLMLCGGGKLPEEIRSRFFSLGGSNDGSLVVIPSASPSSDRSDHSKFLRYWQSYAWKKVSILHIGDRHDADRQDIVDLLKTATAIWITGGDQNRLASRYQGTLVESQIAELIRRGGVVGGTSAGSAIASQVMIAGGHHLPVIKFGFDLLPNAIVDQHFSQRNRHSRLSSAVKNYPERVGFGIDEGTALIFGPEKTEVIGNGNVYIYQSPRKLPDTNAQDLSPTVVSSGSTIAKPDLMAITE